MPGLNPVVDAFIDAIRSGEWDDMKGHYAPDVIFDATVPRWHFSIQGVDTVVDQMREWFPYPASLTDIIVESSTGGAVVAFERRWQRPGEPGMSPELVGVRQTHILRINGGRITEQRGHCAGIWDEATFAEIALDAPSVYD